MMLSEEIEFQEDEYESKMKKIKSFVPSSLQEELKNYEKFGTPFGEDVLSFWKARQLDFPQLASIAKSIFSIHPTSVASEKFYHCLSRWSYEYREPFTLKEAACWLKRYFKENGGDLDTIDHFIKFIQDINMIEAVPLRGKFKHPRYFFNYAKIESFLPPECLDNPPACTDFKGQLEMNLDEKHLYLYDKIIIRINSIMKNIPDLRESVKSNDAIAEKFDFISQILDSNARSNLDHLFTNRMEIEVEPVGIACLDALANWSNTPQGLPGNISSDLDAENHVQRCLIVATVTSFRNSNLGYLSSLSNLNLFSELIFKIIINNYATEFLPSSNLHPATAYRPSINTENGIPFADESSFILQDKTILNESFRFQESSTPQRNVRLEKSISSESLPKVHNVQEWLANNGYLTPSACHLPKDRNDSIRSPYKPAMIDEISKEILNSVFSALLLCYTPSQLNRIQVFLESVSRILLKNPGFALKNELIKSMSPVLFNCPLPDANKENILREQEPPVSSPQICSMLEKMQMPYLDKEHEECRHWCYYLLNFLVQKNYLFGKSFSILFEKIKNEIKRQSLHIPLDMQTKVTTCKYQTRSVTRREQQQRCQQMTYSPVSNDDDSQSTIDEDSTQDTTFITQTEATSNNKNMDELNECFSSMLKFNSTEIHSEQLSTDRLSSTFNENKTAVIRPELVKRESRRKFLDEHKHTPIRSANSCGEINSPSSNKTVSSKFTGPSTRRRAVGGGIQSEDDTKSMMTNCYDEERFLKSPNKNIASSIQSCSTNNQSESMNSSIFTLSQFSNDSYLSSNQTSLLVPSPNVAIAISRWKQKISADPNQIYSLIKTSHLIDLLNQVLYSKKLSAKSKHKWITEFKEVHADVFWLRFGDQITANNYFRRLEARIIREKNQKSSKDSVKSKTFNNRNQALDETIKSKLSSMDTSDDLAFVSSIPSQISSKIGKFFKKK